MFIVTVLAILFWMVFCYSLV